MTQSQSCGCDKETKKDPQKNDGLSTSGIKIMSSMEPAAPSCSKTNSNPMAIHEKPGFKLCSYVKDFIKTDVGDIPLIKTELGKDDLFSSFYVRCGINRHQYSVCPGLYAIGDPDKDSEVLVTANFKLTFDHLRKELKNINTWILVLDTRGVNVWCAASEGTFATGELVEKIKAVHLEKIVNHKRVIVPQLGATGVSARAVKKQSGFRVIFGPIRANDILAFLKNDKKADKEMRQVTFDMYERFILTPVEIQIVLKPTLIIALILFVLSGIGPGIFSFSGAWERGMISSFALIVGIFSGAFITPIILPFLPVKEFALKGIIVGSFFVLILLFLFSSTINGFAGFMGFAGFVALFLFSVSISSFLAMNFTGTTPFTSPSGVEKEMKRYIPMQLCALILSSGFWIYSAF